MATMTMPTTGERARSDQTRGVGQLMPLLLAIALLVATGVISVLVTGPMH